MTAEERGAQPQNLILEGRRALSISGVAEVEGFDDAAVHMRTSLGSLTVRGEELRIESLSVETGELLLRGRINEIIYEELPERSGILGRLLG